MEYSHNHRNGLEPLQLLGFGLTKVIYNNSGRDFEIIFQKGMSFNYGLIPHFFFILEIK